MKKEALVLGFVFLIVSPAMAATDEENKQILKDALVGAVTGAVAVEATNNTPKTVEAAAESPTEVDKHKHWWKGKKNFKEKKRHHHDEDKDENHEHRKDKKRPHGWDMGKKTGWGDKDVPPGHAKKDSD